jgi:CBS domain-containing protein
MTPATRLHSVRAADSLASVLQMMAEHDVNQLPVVEGRTLAGMLDRGDVMRFIRVRREMREMAGDAPKTPAPAGPAPAGGAPPAGEHRG